MKVRLLKFWNQFPPGQVVTLSNARAALLVKEGVAVNLPGHAAEPPEAPEPEAPAPEEELPEEPELPADPPEAEEVVDEAPEEAKEPPPEKKKK